MRLGRLLYSPDVGRLAGLVLASGFAFILANNAVRVDALLTGAVIFTIWQLAEFSASGRWRNLVLAGLGLALGFATKGMIGIGMPVIAIALHLVYRRDWARVFDWRWLVLAVVVLVLVSPVLYAYYRQFGVDGVRFILWSQNLERLAGGRFGRSAAGPAFFFHTFLWAFLPWSLRAGRALGPRPPASRCRAGIAGTPGGANPGHDRGAAGHHFRSPVKLPHYLNILLPLFSVVLAGWLAPRQDRPVGRAIWVTQGLLFVLAGLFAVVVCGWAFPVERRAVTAAFVGPAAAGWWLTRSRSGGARLVVASVSVAALLNFLLNFSFFPQLLRYQAGNNLAQAARRLRLDLGAVSVPGWPWPGRQLRLLHGAAHPDRRD